MRKSDRVVVGSRGKVLVVDDEVMIRELVSLILEGEGFAVATAESAHALSDVVRCEAPDVVVLDVGLRGMKGDRAVEAVRAGTGSRVPIILFSGESEEQLRCLAARSGADGAVTKTSAPAALIHEVQRAISVVGSPAAPMAAEVR